MEIYSNKANGKLLLTSEYYVLDGASAIALPTKFGQKLSVVENDLNSSSPFIHWISYDENGGIWGDIAFDNDINPNIENDYSLTLKQILCQCVHFNSRKLNTSSSYIFKTQLEFNRSWGLGSSSTLIALLADFFEINAYQLLEKTFGGSGYDIACAFNNSPILYTRTIQDKPAVQCIPFNPKFSDKIFFVYSGNKQNSRSGIAMYKALQTSKVQIIEELNQLNNSILASTSIEEFENLIDQHEEIISKNLDLKTIKEERFSDYWGSIKSLGAWGGDFLLMTNKKSKNELLEYLKTKEIDILFEYHELILS